MHRFRFSALRQPASATWPRVSRWLAFVILLAVASAAAGVDESAAPAPATEAVKVPAPTTSKAAALDRKIIAEAQTDPEIMRNLAFLSDVIGPRLTGSAALKRANEWAAEKMRSYGLTNVRLEPYEIPVGWERGTASARIIEPNNGRSLMLAAMGWTPGTNGKIQGDVVVLTAKTTAELAALKGKLKNAIVLRGPPSDVRPITENTPPRDRTGPPRRPPGTPPAQPGTPPAQPGTPPAQPAQPGTPPAQRGGPPRAFGQMRAFQRELSEFLRVEGAAVILMDAGKPHGLLTTTGAWRGTDRPSAADPLPAAFVAHEHYALLYRLATRPAPARTRVEIEITNKIIPGPIVVYNTVGEIRGGEKPDEFVVVGAHLDSWDLAQGTTDNGTGSTVVLEAARTLAHCGTRPQRTIRFVLFTGEEQGLHGSKAYVKRHKDELDRTSACLAHDTGTGRVIGFGLQGRAPLKPIFDAELAGLKDLGFKEIDLRGMGGTDHLSFEQAGVPGFALRQDMTEYRLTHHSQSDTLDKARAPDLIQGSQVMAVVAMRIANLPNLLPREKK